jgi:hypothetical protein
MMDSQNGLLLSDHETPDWFRYPPEFIHVIELGIHRLDPWKFALGHSLRDLYELVCERYPHRELVPFADWEDLVACWEKDQPGKVIVINLALPEYYGLIKDGFWDWFLSAINQMISDSP